jgi:hypothetical protein
MMPQLEEFVIAKTDLAHGPRQSTIDNVGPTSRGVGGWGARSGPHSRGGESGPDFIALMTSRT